MLTVSKILTSNSKKIIVDLINLSNYGRLIEEHVDLEFSSNSEETQSVVVKSRITSTTGVTGLYKGQKTVHYKRPLIKTLMAGTPTFTIVSNYPFTFKTLKEKLLNEFGFLLENKDIADYKNSLETMTDGFEFNQSYPEIVNNKIHLYVSPKSPRFCPHHEPSIIINPVDYLGNDLNLLLPTTELHPLHSLDNF